MASTVTDGPTTRPRGAAQRTVWPLVLLGGLVGGLAWGANARLWMRFISTDPEFTLAGTLFIVSGFGLAGLGQAGAYLGRRAELPRPRLTVLRVVTFASLLPLGMAAGGPMFPAVVLAALAITHVEWAPRTRWLVAAIAAIPVVATGVVLFDELSVVRAAIGSVWFLVIYAGIVWAARMTLAPQRDGWKAPWLVRGAGLLALGAVAVFETRFLTGA